MATGNGPARYTASFSKPLLDAIRVWVEEAKSLGRGVEFLAALREINERLETDPHGWGDRLRGYPVINAFEMRGMIPQWLLAWYGVDDRARQVIVRRLLPAPGSPLSPPV